MAKQQDGDNLATKENLLQLIEGTLPWETSRGLMRMENKDEDRFQKYIEVLQERASWPDKILVRIAEHLYVVQKKDKSRVVKCTCGQEFGDYRVNWKLSCRVRVRKTEAELAEVISLDKVIPNPELVEAREFYCPGCLAQLAVEVVPVGYPVIFEMLPDIDQVYREQGMPLPDQSPEWFEDRTTEQTRLWAKGVK
ncbi:MAG: acetone carboxylase subunit gamma [Sterolibacterium sp.]